MKSCKALSYIRVSTEMQVEGYSLDSQKEIIRDFAERNNITIVKEYPEEGKSGTNISGRPKLKELLKDIEYGTYKDIEYVICYSLSRFGRNAADTLYNLQFMEDYGIGLYCIKDSLDSKSSMGKLITTIMSAVVEMEHDNILAQTMTGRIQKAKEGGWNGGFAPYGYKLIDGELIINEEEAKVIRIIFEKYAQTTLGANGVANWLNNHGYKKVIRQNGTLDAFSAHFIKLVIDNPVYMGKIAFGRRKTEKIKGRHNEKHIVKQNNYSVYDGIHEAIVSEELWNTCHDKREETGIRPDKREKEHEYILSGLVKCPCCGAPMYGIPSRKKRKDGTPYPVSYGYICRNQSRATGHLNCTWKKQVNCKLIDKAVENVIFSLVSNGQFNEEVQKIIGEKIDISELKQQRENLKKQLRQLDGTQTKTENQLLSLDSTSPTYDLEYESYKGMLIKVFERKNEIANLIEDVEGRINAAETNRISRDTVYEYLLKFKEIYPVISDYEKKMVMQTIISSIDLYTEKQENGQWVKCIHLKFPVSYNGSLVEEIFPRYSTTDECVVLMSSQKS